ncbi:type VI secretion system-associated FHA domain protein TagH [Vibrio harveyi]|uniref:type VI secretion system-associated FHA domain protein TagH n=1 Tax=Vibrio harveyi TaxID=669 RepID=UPI000C7A03A0|nr:type VI secretion system-associated FHA domain protein TagH [Vibrio harveyi]AWB01627.1 type VI secretion system-associated FHA domain protein TagH [Vibrio harveyi]EKO3847073.1 type VI secretion system-associated FHA domain protein TagH [Vibrio harveyi]MDF6012698.1 type VI secretion system-associated FHA domain protein TagH [Vibrio harveyi]
MTLVLTITSFHKFTPEIDTEFVFDATGEHDKVSFGRSEQCDWTLPDPERVISSKHGELIKFGEKYLIKDLSTNGTFVNNAVTPVGQGNELALNHGDVVALGDYQIQVSLEERIIDDSNIVHNTINELAVGDVDRNLTHDEFGLNAADLLRDSAPSEFQLDIGLMDDFLEAQEPSVEEVSPHASTPISAQKPLVKNESKNQQAFVRGLGINPNMVPDENSEQWFEQLGQSFSLMLLGLMETLHNRAEFKQNNRLNHTAFRKSENNPLKFSANLEDAIHNLYNRNTASFMRADIAIKEAFVDIENHEKALMKGVEGTVSSVMSLVEPSSIYSDAMSSDSFFNKIIPARKYAQSWKKFEGIHYQLTDEIINKESPFYLEDFAKHYENALRSKN